MRKVTTEELNEFVLKSTNWLDLARKMNRAPVGGNVESLKKRCIREGIDTSHFNGRSHNKGKSPVGKQPASHHLRLYPKHSRRITASIFRRCMIEVGIPYKCAGPNCPLTDEWNGKKLVLEVDHINEKYWDSRKENLQFLCPNCHSTK